VQKHWAGLGAGVTVVLLSLVGFMSL
jgi:hypothetical protein